MIKKYKGQCVSSVGDGAVYVVTERRKKKIPDLATVKARCKKVVNVSDDELEVLGDEKEDLKSVLDSFYQASSKEPKAKLLSQRKVCSILVVGQLYSHRHEYYRLQRFEKMLPTKISIP